MRAVLLGFVALLATDVAVDAKPRACTSAELQAGLTDNMVIGCTGKGGTVKCDRSGTVVCCKKLQGGGEICVTADNLQFLHVKPPEATKPPSGGGTPPSSVKP